MAVRRSLVAVDLAGAEPFIKGSLPDLGQQIAELGNKLEEKQRSLPSLELPFHVREAELRRITHVAQELRANSEVLIILAGGGCYLAARGVVEAFSPPLRGDKQLLFAGIDVSPDHLGRLGEHLGHKRVSMMAASLGEPCLELAAAFRFLRSFILQRHGRDEGRRRIVLVADDECASWQSLAQKDDHRLIQVSEKASPQWSSTLPSTLLAMALADIEATQFLEGARSLVRGFDKAPFEHNECFRFAAARMALLAGQLREVLVLPDPQLHWLGRWWLQLVAASAANMGPPACFPTACTDGLRDSLLGPFPLTGDRPAFETHLLVGASNIDPELPAGGDQPDGLEHLTGARLSEIQAARERAVTSRLQSADAPFVTLEIPKLDPFSLGALCCFLETATAVAHKLGGVPPWHDGRESISVRDLEQPAGT